MLDLAHLRHEVGSLYDPLVGIPARDHEFNLFRFLRHEFEQVLRRDQSVTDSHVRLVEDHHVERLAPIARIVDESHLTSGSFWGPTVDYYIDQYGPYREESPPFMHTWDTRAVKRGEHVLKRPRRGRRYRTV